MSKKTAATSSSKDNDSKKKPDNNAHSPHYLMWFRRDLRIHDNTALAAICEQANASEAPVTAVYFITPEQWLEHDDSLVQVDHIARTLPILAQKLEDQLNIALNVYLCADFDKSIEAITELCAEQKITTVMANHEYEGNEIDRDEKLTKQLANDDIEFIRHHDQCILPPLSITTNDGDSMYKVFTPFYRKWRDTLEAGSLSAHEATKVTANNKTKARIKSMALKSATDNANTSASIEKLAHKIVADYQKPLEYDEKKFTDKPAQLKQAREDYPAGEDAAIQRLKEFVAEDIEDYDVSRDKPILQGTSHLSAYLTIGAISPRLCYLQAAQAQEKLHGNDSDNEDINRWISELAWRDFYRHVLVDKPKLIEHKAYKEDADNKVNWSYDKDDFAAWCAGKTGVPLVDAAMRCLNATGFMHNRLRMVTAMFLTKDLLIDWRWGERYFMQQLIDGDFASNNGGWQWSASTGTDSAPYFRIMNPFSQGKSHDAKGEFIKTWLPELKDVPVSTLHSEDTMRKALKKGGEFADIDYPVPMVEHKEVRKLAIAEFKK
ncbi:MULTISPECIES: cryptochrome/photolyase family protein [unclassified Psychrobacter]|uniref:cryptochrome/photolyase family protein n=1 Tax=unclassified Psychrobacter TaxID=196806 RepID=UPI0003FF37CD|nr:MULTISPECIES: FAD-binding domain-containing protein [unclassified Psychrobacter]